MIVDLRVSDNFEYQTWMVSSNAYKDKFCISLDQSNNSAIFEQENPAMDFLLVDRKCNIYHVYISFTSFEKDCWHVLARKNIDQTSNSFDVTIDFENGNLIEIKEDNEIICKIELHVTEK
ncbi:hypothetical protein FCV43_10820 [Vibrio genomosp. F6]|uniref:hypothetical protein n=1 Tax=Vibrio genomosp. F6 TaxID=723172 RepID=UPI0010BDE1F9|nr:hypothetical protein [Vibrio genomosp. F6]TKF21805.1 hypothetical protein FCV43_10820 [Vibrio genomosp. F6]